MPKLFILVASLRHPFGMERTIAHRVSYWVRNGMEITIVTLNQGSDPLVFGIGKLPVHHVDLDVHYDSDRSLFSINNVISSVCHFSVLAKLIRRAQPDYVLKCDYGYDFYFIPLLSNRKSFLIKENHSSRYSEFMSRGALSRIKRSVRRFFESKYDANVFLSYEERDISRLRNAVVIPNPIPDQGALHPPANARKNVVIAAGRLVELKGFDRLIKVWKKFYTAECTWELHIYGDGDSHYKDYLLKLIVDNSLSTSVKIFDSVDNLPEVMCGSRIFALSSFTECFPMVVLEAFQSGLPVVSFDCPTGPRNMIENGVTGFVVSDEDYDDYADKIRLLVNDSGLLQNLSENCKGRSLDYSIDRVMEMWNRDVFSRGVGW